jgi:DNA-binding transcriptional LysR family regulator
MLPAFLPHLPLIRVDWRFETWRVDLIAEGYDAAIGGDIELPSGIAARPLAPAHLSSGDQTRVIKKALLSLTSFKAAKRPGMRLR